MIKNEVSNEDRRGNLIKLTTKDGKNVVFINVEKRLAFIYTSGIEEVHECYFEHIERFALDLCKATGHHLDPKIL